MLLYPNAMGDSPHVWFCWNHWWGRVIEGGSASDKEIVLTLHMTINWAAADHIACGVVTPNLLRAALSQHHGGLPPRLVLSESTVGVSNWGGSASAN